MGQIYNTLCTLVVVVVETASSVRRPGANHQLILAPAAGGRLWKVIHSYWHILEPPHLDWYMHTRTTHGSPFPEILLV